MSWIAEKKEKFAWASTEKKKATVRTVASEAIANNVKNSVEGAGISSLLSIGRGEEEAVVALEYDSMAENE